MADISSFDGARKLLEQYIPKHGRVYDSYKLERMTALMDALGNPQHEYKVIHIAGTSGKSSTAYFMAALISQSGAKVGLTVSPHIDEINERLQINLQPMPEKAYCKAFNTFMRELAQIDLTPTYFELLVAFAYWEFAQQKVDYAVIEVGIGGLLDGTNVVRRADKVCIITDIGLDHTHILGSNLFDIAKQKAGIIQLNNAVFMYHQSDDITETIVRYCGQQEAGLQLIDYAPQPNLPTNLASFQQRNWYLAFQVYKYLATRDTFPKLNPNQIAASSEVMVPARMEIIKIGGKTVILDGAHNAQKLATLRDGIEQRFPTQPKALLLSFASSESFDVRTSGLKDILDISSHAIATSFLVRGGAGRASVNPEKIKSLCVDLGFENISVIEDPINAFNTLLQQPEDILVITGSFYIFSILRPVIHHLATQ